jgi:hypothetical protein
MILFDVFGFNMGIRFVFGKWNRLFFLRDASSPSLLAPNEERRG